MKQIEKRTEPAEFVRWKRRQVPQASYGALSGRENAPVRHALMSALRRDQGDLCCFCMCRIPPCNVEHIKPRTSSKKAGTGEDVSWSNLLASCVASDPDGIETTPPRCNGRRRDRFLRVSPLQTDCEAFFVFSPDGVIAPSPDPARRESGGSVIEILGLDDPFLTDRRAAAIRGLGLEDLDRKEIRRLRDAFIRRNSDGQFKEFAAAIAFVLSQWIKPAYPPRARSKQPGRRPHKARS